MRFLVVFYGITITHQYSLDRAYCPYRALKLCQNIQVYNNNLLISHKIRIRKLHFLIILVGLTTIDQVQIH